MSVSFTLLKANGQRFDPLPGSTTGIPLDANAADVLDALGLEIPSPNASADSLFRRSSSSPGASVSATPPQPSPSPIRGSRDDARDRLRPGRSLHRAKLAKLSDP